VHYERLGYVVSTAIVVTVLLMHKIDRLVRAGGAKVSVRTLAASGGESADAA
jgi:hypothetical protein